MLTPSGSHRQLPKRVWIYFSKTTYSEKDTVLWRYEPIKFCTCKLDPNFATYAREMNKVKFVHDFVKKNFFHPRNEVHYPCLKILRVLAKDRKFPPYPDGVFNFLIDQWNIPKLLSLFLIISAKARHLLGRDKFFHTLKKIMELYVASPSTKFQMALDILVMLTRNSSK